MTPAHWPPIKLSEATKYPASQLSGPLALPPKWKCKSEPSCFWPSTSLPSHHGSEVQALVLRELHLGSLLANLYMETSSETEFHGSAAEHHQTSPLLGNGEDLAP
ncbi:uncharacterized protein CIMG_12946 [Coccidioides immitis RS]|uniref:Uncharacterized protein n=1 Tax=Coccidioides immitis (strain RS) TaxID=246410 RepID=A0A0D8JST0_COCIM|nr:uncharacterized protein CIMG_12946 [Coccidioides immitis RS]KJF60405.1 hypothetical protein CIMG_12946 [Coccidioides immitis RS]